MASAFADGWAPDGARAFSRPVAIRGGVLGGDNRISGSHHPTARSAESAIERYSQLSCERPNAQSKGLTGQCENHFVNQLQLAAQDLAADVNVRNIT